MDVDGLEVAVVLGLVNGVTTALIAVSAVRVGLVPAEVSEGRRGGASNREGRRT